MHSQFYLTDEEINMVIRSYRFEIERNKFSIRKHIKSLNRLEEDDDRYATKQKLYQRLIDNCNRDIEQAEKRISELENFEGGIFYTD